MLCFILFSLLSFSLVCAEDDGDSSDGEFFNFLTRPDILAPKWDIKTYYPEELYQEGYWFIAPYDNIHQVNFPFWNGPHIYDTSGELIWSGAPRMDYINTMDFRMSEVDGQQMLSYIWNGDDDGNGWILDSSYELYTIVDMVGNSSRWNFHELNLIDNGRRALMATSQDFSPIPLHVPQFNGSCRIAKQGFKEVDVKTGEIYFEWHTLGHIRPEESVYVGDDVVNNTWKAKCAQNWDITHINAVDKFDDGDYLISARHTDTIYKVSHKDRSIVWRLGGRFSDFEVRDSRLRFGQQHHARVRGQNETHTLISLFDNAAGGGSVENLSGFQSWGMLIALRTDTTPMTAELVTRYQKPYNEYSREYTKSRGSLSFLPNGNAFIGWVLRSHLAEYSPDGKLLMSAMLKKEGAASYRSYKMPWAGRPAQPPDVLAIARIRDDVMTTIVHVSWNGATEVATWNLLRTNSFGTITSLMASIPRQGFESRFIVSAFAEHVIVVALDKKGEEIGRSKVERVRLPSDLHTPSLDYSEHEWLRNHSSSWWHAEPVRSETWKGFDVLAFGILVLVILICVGVGVRWWLQRTTRRKGPSWWIGGQVIYRSVESDEAYRDDHQAWELEEETCEVEEVGYADGSEEKG